MDLLEFSMENQNSSSPVRRLLAKAAKVLEVKKADLYEARLNRKNIQIPEDADDGAMLRSIWEEIAKQEKE